MNFDSVRICKYAFTEPYGHCTKKPNDTELHSGQEKC